MLKKIRLFDFTKITKYILGSKKNEGIVTSPSVTSISKNVNNNQKTVVSKRKRRDRVPERPNYR